MKMKKSLLLPGAIIVAAVLSSISSASARPEYFFSYNGANFIYGSKSACLAESSVTSCVEWDSNLCGRVYASSERTYRLWRLLYAEGHALYIKSRSSNSVVCNVGS